MTGPPAPLRGFAAGLLAADSCGVRDRRWTWEARPGIEIVFAATSYGSPSTALLARTANGRGRFPTSRACVPGLTALADWLPERHPIPHHRLLQVVSFLRR